MSEERLAAGLKRRNEDYGLITGRSRFVDDLRPPKGRPQALYMAVVRSPYAHAGIESIKLDAALALPGVVAAFAGSELMKDMREIDYVPLPGLKNTKRRPLAIDKVRYVGDPVAVVEIETGEVRILSYIAVDDCGQVLNHYLAEAQIHGGLAQGIGQALYEEVIYDQDGQLLTSTLMDYALPLADEVPDFVTDLVETPSPLNPLGAKGVGEAGCIGAPPAIVNAVLDALAPLGIDAMDMPLKPEKVWKAIQEARPNR